MWYLKLRVGSRWSEETGPTRNGPVAKQKKWHQRHPQPAFLVIFLFLISIPPRSPILIPAVAVQLFLFLVLFSRARTLVPRHSRLQQAAGTVNTANKKTAASLTPILYSLFGRISGRRKRDLRFSVATPPFLLTSVVWTLWHLNISIQTPLNWRYMLWLANFHTLLIFKNVWSWPTYLVL